MCVLSSGQHPHRLFSMILCSMHPTVRAKDMISYKGMAVVYIFQFSVSMGMPSTPSPKDRPFETPQKNHFLRFLLFFFAQFAKMEGASRSCIFLQKTEGPEYGFNKPLPDYLYMTSLLVKHSPFQMAYTIATIKYGDHPVGKRLLLILARPH